MAAAAEPAFPIDVFAGRFVLVRPFAGGEGSTALVREPATGRELVVKVLPAGVELAESELLVSLRHPAIPAVREAGRLADGRPFLLRDHVAGTPLNERLPLTAAQALDVAQQVLELLAFVHLRGVLHLDLKPGNLLLDPAGTVHLLDFGLGARTGQGARGGTPFFAAPEQLLGGAPDARADLFALGAVLVVALWPGAGKGPSLPRFLREFPARPFLAACGVAASDFPAPFDAFLPRCLARRPVRRFGDAREALEFLRPAGGRPPVSLLRPDPIALLADPIDAALAAIGDDEPLLTGGDPGDREALALHCLYSLDDATRLVPCADGLRVERDAAVVRGARAVAVPPLQPVAVSRHLQECLGLTTAAADGAAGWLLTDTAPTAQAIGDRLRTLAEAGAIVPDGTRWSWPAAQTGRLTPTMERLPDPTPAGVEAAAAAGRAELAEALFRAAAEGATAAAERDLRSRLTRGLLAAGEPTRALPWCADLPALRAQCLLDLGRLRDVDALLPVAQREAEADPAIARSLARTAAQLAVLRGRPRQAIAALATLEPRTPEETITLAAATAAAGQPAQALALLDPLLAGLAPASTPYLRAAALTERFLARRGLGDAEAGRADLEEAQALLFRLGNARAAAAAARNLGVLAKDRGDFAAAVEHLRQARALARHVRDDAGVAVAEANLGIVALAAGDPAAARQRLQQAAAELEQLGGGDALDLCRVMLARAEADLGHAAAAEAMLAQVDTGRSTRLQHEAARVRERLAAGSAATSPGPAADAPPQQPPETSPPVTDRDGVSRELFRTFLAVNRRLGAESDLEQAMEYLLEAAVTLTGGRRGYLLVSRPDGLRREFESGDPNPGAQAFSRSLANRAMQVQRTLTGADALRDRELADMPSIRNLETRSAICAPFRAASGAAGAIYVEHPGRADVFQDRDREYLEVLADQAAIAVERMLREELLAAELQASRREVAVARHMASRTAPTMVGRSPQLAKLKQQIERLGGQDLPVLILGETGTGKELVARAIHDGGGRRRGPFVAENCSALPAELMERELFGHVQGSFTGADRDRPGLLELADGGTLFLDEVGDMPPALQAKLLRVLQEKAIRRIGGQQSVQVDVRVLAATHKDLRGMVADGAFREDLYYRLAAIELQVPPLRQRDGDIDVLADHFLKQLNQKHARACRLSDAARAALRRHPWPGNVRELEHVLARAFLLTDGDLIASVDLPEPVPRAAAGGDAAAPTDGAAAPDDGSWPVLTLAEAERRTIVAALAACGGDKTAAARTLGISRTAIYDKIKRHGIET